MLEELKNANLSWIEKDFQDAILHGWSENGNKIDWYNLSCAFFAEEVKTNTRLSTIIQTEYLASLNSIKNGFNQNIENYIAKHQDVLPKINEIIDILESNKNEIIKEVIEGNESIEELIKQEKKTLYSIEEKIDRIVKNQSPQNIQLLNDDLMSNLSLSSIDLGIEVLKYINAQAKNLYENKIYGNDKARFNKYVWDEIFSQNDFQSQKEFVEVITNDNQEVKYYTLNSLSENQNRIWLIGEAGVGKTTTLYSIFFSLLLDEARYPIPLLIQPQEFDSHDINIFKNTKNVVESLIINLASK